MLLAFMLLTLQPTKAHTRPIGLTEAHVFASYVGELQDFKIEAFGRLYTDPKPRY